MQLANSVVRVCGQTLQRPHTSPVLRGTLNPFFRVKIRAKDSERRSRHVGELVGNIPYDATEELLVQICEEVGPVVSFRLVVDKETGKPKGYGFCEYKDEETALSARRNLQGHDVNGRQLRVDFAENGRNTDRNREKGRGGPGMSSTVDAQKQLTTTPAVGDTSLHQLIGLPPAIHAASVMAGVLGGAQTANVQNGLPVQFGLGNDPLTHYLARMSRHQLYEIMSELKTLTTQNNDLAKKLLQGIPQLPKALFQAQIMLGLVTPQMMQMAKSQQPSSSLAQSSHLNESFPQPDDVLPIVHKPPPNPNVMQEQTALLHNFPQYQHSSQPPVKMFPHGHQSGVLAHPPMLPQPFGTSSSVPTQPLVTSGGLISQVQPSFLTQHPRPPVMPTNVQQLPLTNPHLPQVIPTGPSGSYSSGAVNFQQPENEAPQLTQDDESALLQQVLQLTPEQLSSLPVEQQQQVIQLQKMLSAGK
ncbi:Cleavage stimulation factor subunit 2 [Triticum urartu]|uniref:Cleavage stimulation factor subunit 2 n=1 Tax=Triticum urartu TaxID=4572 RepID=M7ZRW6_TRIUA|nr:Cleavage stimulation factor subunit 2 [Triticum urartu]